jgi:hypothetical protein
MDPRSGGSHRPKQPKQTPATPGDPSKIKSVTLTVEWGYDTHSVTIGQRNWQKVQAGKAWGTRGEPYYYEGKRFGCYWAFNGRGQPGSLIVSYGNGGGEGYCGAWADVDITENYA